MKSLILQGEKFNAEKIIKTENTIIGQNVNGEEVFKIKNITDFNIFNIVDANGIQTTYDI